MSVIEPRAWLNVEIWVKNVVLPVLSPNGQVIWNATRWHPRDIYGSYILESPTYKGNISILKALNVDDRGEEEALWPQMWPLKKLYGRKRRLGVRYSSVSIRTILPLLRGSCSGRNG